MLGYTKDDLDDMIKSVSKARLVLKNSGYSDEDTLNDLVKIEDFLNGLWAEGYFD